MQLRREDGKNFHIRNKKTPLLQISQFHLLLYILFSKNDAFSFLLMSSLMLLGPVSAANGSQCTLLA